MPTNLQTSIQSALQAIPAADFRSGHLDLLKTLGYASEKTMPIPDADPAKFVEMAEANTGTQIQHEKAKLAEWTRADILFQLTDDELGGQSSLFDATELKPSLLQSYLFFAIELSGSDYSRTALSDITRQINRLFPMPVMVLFTYDGTLSIAVINRRQNKREQHKDVLGKVTLIHGIRLADPHRGHLEILESFSVPALTTGRQVVDSFDSLHTAWEEIFNVELLNKKFYRELSNWYFWAMRHCHFPYLNPETDKYDLFKDKDKVREHDAKNLIRLLTRILFVWFIKQKGLVPDSFFDPASLEKELLKTFDPGSTETHYYKAVLQNLFFATLNQTHGKREFRKPGQHHNTTTLLRYEDRLEHPEQFIATVEATTPFLNGGLFDCLDYPHPTRTGPQGGAVTVYEDGFSDRRDNPLKVPDFLFFGPPQEVDLSDDYGDTKRKKEKVRGLIHILDGYKFTIVENTPIEQEIALDPELLGQVFENLLASYNEETKTTARKQTGSFYTPRPIVDYMVDESLKAHLEQILTAEGAENAESNKTKSISSPSSASSALSAVQKNFLSEIRQKLDDLFAYNDKPNTFNEAETDALIRAIDNCKILDPACGSGAFPMGVLQKLVYVLGKLDPRDELWEKRQLAKVDKLIEAAQDFDDASFRERAIADAEAQRKDIEEAFANNELGYGRKLYLIENCLYGVDIQSIATQVSKLRFFISLIVDQTVKRSSDIPVADPSHNFGIRPLPNLETKFVTADTLIRIEKPQAQGELFEIAEVSELQKQLKQVRHDLFSAKTPRTKRKHRERDEELRAAIAEELKQNGWASDAADKLAAWDPYDQNASAPYFDPEWMFGLTGFDIVIGNPPYLGNKEIGAQKQKTYLNVFGVKDDMYSYFFLRGFTLLHKGGILSFITSNTFLTLITKQFLREDLQQKRIIEIANIGEVFEAAIVNAAVTTIENTKTPGDYSLCCYSGNPSDKAIIKHSTQISIYRNALNRAFFSASPLNLTLYKQFNAALLSQYKSTWTMIKTARARDKNREKIQRLIGTLKPDETAFLGLICEGAQGLVTGNNSKYIARICDTEEEGLKVFDEFIDKLKALRPESNVTYTYAKRSDAYEVAERLKQAKKRPTLFGKFFLYKTVQRADLVDYNDLSEREKRDGCDSEVFLPYYRGNDEGHRWNIPLVESLLWSEKSVNELREGKKTNSRWQGEMHYGTTGFGWVDYFTDRIKAFFVPAAPYSKNVVKFHSNSYVSDKYLVAILNSRFICYFIKNFITSTHTLQINDGKMVPIVMPRPEKHLAVVKLADRIVSKRKVDPSADISEEESKLEKLILEIYRISDSTRELLFQELER